MKMAVEWRDEVRKYGPAGRQAMLGKFIVGSAVWNQIHKNQPPYEALLRLPGYKDRLGRFETETEAMACVERAVWLWIVGAGLGSANFLPGPAAEAKPENEGKENQ
jgi:hypothetical protein